MTTRVAINMEPVESTQIHSIGHDEATGTLAVRFQNKEGMPTSLYHYSGVPRDLFEEFKAAESAGKFLGAKIKALPEQYPCDKQIEAETAEE